MKHRTERRDHGMTLIEVMIAGIVMAMVAAVMVGALAVVLRNSPTSQDRIDAAVTAQSLVTFLPPDVDSTAPGMYDVDPATASGCAGTDEGRNVLRLSWTEETFSTTTFVANYRFVEDATGGRIYRYACNGVGSLGSPSVISMTSTLPLWNPADPPVAVTLRNKEGQTLSQVAVPADFVAERVDVKLTTEAGDSVFIEGASKNPAETLPPIGSTIAPTTIATTTTTTTTTIPAPTTTYTGPATTSTTTTSTTPTTTIPPCIVSGMTVTPSSMELKNSSQSRLKNDVVVQITLGGGYCVGLNLQYDTGGSNGQYVQNFPTTSPYTVTLQGHPQGNENWSVGPHTLAVVDSSGAVLASGTLNVTN